MPTLFLAVVGFAVFCIFGWWIPMRAGRGPMASYDFLCALAVIGSLAGTSAGAVGLALWIPGIAGLLGATSIYLATDAFCWRFRDWAIARLSLIFGASFLAVFAASLGVPILTRRAFFFQ